MLRGVMTVVATVGLSGLVACGQAGAEAASVSPGPAAQTSRFAVEGMTCVSCANTIREDVLRHPGVKRAIVLFAVRQLEVTWKEGAARDDEAIVARVDGLGYTLKPAAPK